MAFIVIFIVAPLVELAVFAALSDHIGLWTTLTLALMTAIIGGLLVKYQGLQTILNMRNTLNQGRLPLDGIFDGFCLVAAGALLITPGFVTDTAGFALLAPPVRRALGHFIRRHSGWFAATGPSGPDQGHRPGDRILEGEYEHVDEAAKTGRNDVTR